MSKAKDGSVVAFDSDGPDLVTLDANGAVDLFLHDLVTGETRILSADCAGNPGDGDTSGCGLSDDGGVAAFASDATNRVADDDNHLYDAFATVPDRTDAAWSSYGQGFAGTLLVVPRVVMPVVVPAAGLSMPVTIPRLPELCGIRAFLQALELDPGAPRRISFTPGLELVFGH